MQHGWSSTASAVACPWFQKAWARPLRHLGCVDVTDVTTTCRFCDIGSAPIILSTPTVFDNEPPTTCQLVHYVCRLRRLRSVTTSVRRKQMSNILKTRVGAVSSWLRRQIATHLAQPALPRCNRRSTGAPRLRLKWKYCRNCCQF